MMKAKYLSVRWPLVACLLAVTASGCAADELRRLGTITDEFTQNAAAMVDILWVVDNSPSMIEEQTGLGESFESFINNLVLSKVDYHIGVISTDVADGGRLHAASGMPHVINPSTRDPQAAFLANVKVPASGSRQEKGFEAAALALGKGIGQWTPDDPEPPPVPNSNFLRRGYCSDDGVCEGTDVSCTSHSECAGAAMFIIFVSDEDDGSFGPVRYYWRLFESYKGPGNEGQIKLSAIVGPPANPSDPEDRGGCINPGRGEAAPGDRYVELVIQSGGTTQASGAADGIVASICEDFTESLTALSITAAGLSAKFRLSSIPKLQGSVACGDLPPEPFCVQVDGEPLERGTHDGWVYDESDNAIVFGAGALPPPQAKINVTYQENR